ncbi:MAG: alpha/beta hydrolase [Acidimicrobiales bacterium]
MATPHPIRRGIAGAAALAGGAATGIWAAERWRRRSEPVAPELRHPVVWAPTDITNERVLRIARRAISIPTPMGPGVTLVTSRIPGPVGGPPVRVLRYEPHERSTPGPALLWIHGGGTIMGRPEQAHAWCSRVAARLGIVVVSVQYRLAPEDPFPAGLDDCLAALEWLHDDAASLGVDPERIAVGGDSAGGGLAAALAQRARDEGGPPIRFQLLVYPMLDDRTVLRADAEGLDGLLWTARSNRFAWTCYLGHPPTAEPERPWAAPARTTDLAGLPPAWIGVGDIDLFHDEDVDYARRLEEAGVPCELHVVHGMFHAADNVLGGAPSMVDFRRRAVRALRVGLGLHAPDTPDAPDAPAGA